MMHSFCSKIYNENYCPENWGKAVIIPIDEKGNRKECSNYRGFRLLSVCGKVYTGLLQQRLKIYVEEIISEEQEGFRGGRVTIDQLFVICQLFGHVT